MVAEANQALGHQDHQELIDLTAAESSLTSSLCREKPKVLTWKLTPQNKDNLKTKETVKQLSWCYAK